MFFSTFYKYESLGNDFVLIDCSTKTIEQILTLSTRSNWPTQVCKICDRHYGIGADGVLIICQNTQKELPEGLLFNADGSNGHISLNGTRCLAHYLSNKLSLSAIAISMANKQINCSKNNKDEVTIKIDKVNYQGTHTLTINDKILNGYIADVGNPHFVIHQKTTLNWLRTHGKKISEHSDFPNRTNVEFIWPEKSVEKNILTYNLVVYERGCGITMACGTGAAAALQVVAKMHAIKPEEKIAFKMPGGIVYSHIDTNGNIWQKAPAHCVFQGQLCE